MWMTLACKTPWAVNLQISLLQQQRWEKSCSWWGSLPLHDTVAVCVVCVCARVALKYVSALRLCLMPTGPREAFMCPGTEVTDGFWLPYGCWELYQARKSSQCSYPSSHLSSLVSCFSSLLFETGFCSIPHAGLKLTVLLYPSETGIKYVT